MKLFSPAFFFFISQKFPLLAHKNYNTIDPPRKKILELPLFKLFFFGEKNWRSTIEDLQKLFFKSFFFHFFSTEYYWRLTIITFDTKSILFNLFTMWYQLCRSINHSFLGIEKYNWRLSTLQKYQSFFFFSGKKYYWRIAIITFDYYWKLLTLQKYQFVRF